MAQLMNGASSFPNEIIPHDDGDEAESDSASCVSSETRPRILLMGLKRSGKSSILKVVFFKMAPNDTLFLESTNNIVKEDISNSTFIHFQIWDIPGQLEICDSTFDYDTEMIFGSIGSLVFVIDAQADYVDALKKLRKTLTTAYKINPMLNFEIFIHKVDGISDDVLMELHRDILHCVSDDLTEEGLEELRLTYHLTSIYDHSVYEAFSQVVQKLIPQLPTLENLLDMFIANSCIDKVFIFDVISKIYIATDSSPVEMQSYELCCDMIDVVLDISVIYGENVDDECSGYDSESSSIIKLNNQTVLYLREINKHLAMVAILRTENFEKRGTIDYNFMCLRRAIKDVFNVMKKSSEPTKSLAAVSEAVPFNNAASAGK